MVTERSVSDGSETFGFLVTERGGPVRPFFSLLPFFFPVGLLSGRPELAISLPVKRFRSVDDKGVDDTKERAEPRNGGLVRT